MALTEAEGDKLCAHAHKLVNPSFFSFRLKANWEEATPLFEKAGACYKATKAWGKAVDAFQQAAKGSERQGSSWNAAKHLERAAEAARELGSAAQAVELHRRASVGYREAGRAQAAADALAKAARLVEGKDAQAAGALYEEALEVVEEDGKLALSGDLFRQAIGEILLQAVLKCTESLQNRPRAASYIRAQAHAEAVWTLLRFAEACGASRAVASQCKAYLSAVIVWLAAQNGRQAWAVYQDALGVEAFAASEQAAEAEGLLDAYRSGDAAAVKSRAMGPVFLDLDTQVVRLAKTLPQGNVLEVAAALGGTAPVMISKHDLDEEDLT